jgi:hypothetical protein
VRALPANAAERVAEIQALGEIQNTIFLMNFHSYIHEFLTHFVSD